MYKSLPFQVKMIEHIIVISYAIMILMNLCEKWRSSNSMGRSNTASATFSSDSLQQSAAICALLTWIILFVIVR